MKFRAPAALACSIPLLLPAVAQAHPGHEVGATLLAGAAHPIGGLDHVVALLVMGAWAAQRDTARPARVPALFVVFMLIGAVVAGTWLSPVMVEAGIALSVVMLGLLLAFRLRPGDVAASLLAALFALFHGMAHGLESGPAGPAPAFLIGFAATSALLLWLGDRITRAVSHLQQQSTLRLAGAVAACVGLVLLG